MTAVDPDPPWQDPNHPLAFKWCIELSTALSLGMITQATLQEALASQELHADYARFLSAPPRVIRPGFPSLAKPPKPVKPARPPKPTRPPPRAKLLRNHKVLWVTSVSPALWKASGEALLDSFLTTQSSGQFLVTTEGGVEPLPHRGDGPPAIYASLDQDTFLCAWLNAYAKSAPVCACPGGPFEPRSVRHVQPCPGSWFNRTAAQRFRKIAALRYAQRSLLVAGHPYKSMIWVDADCLFKHRVPEPIVEQWFHSKADAFYFQNKRPTPETGLFGLSLLRNGLKLLKVLSARYETGIFRRDPRWDDSFQFLEALKQSGVIGLDLAVGLANHGRAIPSSPAGHYIQHEEGRHSLKLKLMT